MRFSAPSEAGAGAVRRGAPYADRIARHVPALILGYFALHVVLRVTSPGGLGLDEAEQMVATQTLEWGYGPQPPLYAWMQWALFQAMGPGKLGLALLKNGLLAVAYLALWAAAIRATGSARLAAVAALSLFLMPAVAWEAQRALTHSVLAVAVAALTVLWAVRRVGAPPEHPPGWGAVAALGALAAAGLLAKANFLFLLVGLAGALAATRRLHRRCLGSVALAAALMAGPALWMARHPALVGQSADKFGAEAGAGPGAALDGLLALGGAVLAFAALLAAAHAVLFWWRLPRSEAPAPGLTRFLGLWLAFGLAAVAIAVVATGTTEVKERWLQPVLTPLPLAATLAAASRIGRGALAPFLALVGALAVAVLVALPLNLRHGGDNPSYQSAPFAAAAAALPAGPGLALVEDDFLAGNLRLLRPGLGVLTPETPALSLAGAPRVAVWWSRDRSSPVPGALAALTRRLTGRDLAALPAHTAVFAYPPPHAGRTFHLHWARLEDGAG